MRWARFPLLVALLLMACNFGRIGEQAVQSATPQPVTVTIAQPATSVVQPTATPSAAPSLPAETTAPPPPADVTAPPATAQATFPPPPTLLTFVPATPQNVVLDFVARACEAQWSTNAGYISCPSDLTNAGAPAIMPADFTLAENVYSVSAPVLVGHLGAGYPEGLGLFGRYPAMRVFAGDTFRAVVGCQGDSPCNVQFALEYYDAAGNYFPTEWEWSHLRGEGLEEVVADLTPLAGQTVAFVLAARAQGNVVDNWVLWIQPRIERDPNAPAPLPPPTSTVTATPPPTAEVPGVISGMVDMSTAPPYLTDDPVLGSSPVVVVFFNQDDGTYWWIHTSLTGHPYFQMSVPPGRYQVVAYAQGVGDQPYVTAGYTGQNPSCGQPLQIVEVDPNERVENIVIADWNEACGADAYRPPKPESVPLP